MMRPKIGITMSSVDGDRTRPKLNEDFSHAIERAGGEVVPLDSFVTEENLLPLDGILFSGGADVDPASYGCLIEPHCETIQPWRDESEIMIARWAVAHDLPILGICRGIQLLNVALGGTLIQHLPDWTREIHRDGQGAPHDVKLYPASRIRELAGSDRTRVNSYHHQAVAQPAPGLVVTAVSEAGIVEAVERPASRYFLAVQWHPERLLGEPFTDALFASFVNAAKND